MSQRFHDRKEAGQILAAQLAAYANRKDVLVLALPRGGVPIGFEVTRALHAPLDVLVVRKLGVPGEEELALGAIAPGGVRVLSAELVSLLHLSDEMIEAMTERERCDLERRERLYRGDHPMAEMRDRTVILVDDGMATGSTMSAALTMVKQQQPAHLVVAVPVAAPTTCEELIAGGVEVICPLKPASFYGVGFWYKDFPQLSDQTVCAMLEHAWNEPLVPGIS